MPHGIAWWGRWPTETTSARDAYKMMAREGDPAFMSLSEAIEAHQTGAATFLDARSASEFKKGHIPGARSLPYYEIEATQQTALAQVTASSPLILYCEGIGCELSVLLGRELKEAGYNNLHVFYGGYPEWRNAGLEIEK